MKTCERQSGESFLAGRLTEDEETAFAEHLESCPRCRTWLEEDAGDPDSWRFARQLLVDTAEHVGAEHGRSFDIVDGGDGVFDSQEQPALVDLPRQVAAWLAPSDDPAMMGRLGSYEIAGVIGRGGMGIVLKGFDPPLNRSVAIKVLDPLLANLGAAPQRFAREAKAMAAIPHENVVPIYAVDDFQGLPYFVMEYIVGGTIESRLREDGSLAIVSVVCVSMQIAQALAAAHAQGVVHRDIKPGNILLDRGTERVRVADFGLARVAHDASCTHSGIVAGTPQYMSPEQVRGEPCDARSDLFSLGSLMYAMCAGHAPFRAETVYGVMQRIVHDLPRSLREQNAEVPIWLERFIARLLGKSPEKRFESAEQVANFLQEELAHQQNPKEVSVPRRVWDPLDQLSLRWHRSRLLRFVCAVTVIVALSASLTFWIAQRGRIVDSETDQMNYKSLTSSDSQAISASAPLWEADGTRETISQADQLAQSYHDTFPTRDDWEYQIEQFRQRLTELTDEPF